MWLPTFRRRSKVALLMEEIDFLRQQVAQLQNYVLMTGGGAPPIQAPTRGDEGPSVDLSAVAYANEAQRLYTSEEEEDIHFALEEGLIDQTEADRRLREVMETANDIELM